MRLIFALLFSLVLGGSVNAATCNDPSGFVKLKGPIVVGNTLAMGSDCQSAVDASGGGNTPGLPKSYITGYIPSNDVTLPNSAIDLTSGVCRDSLNTIDIIGGAFVKSMTATWALGSGNAVGGLDAGVVAANTTYHIFRIIRSDTLVSDMIISTSASAPTLPTSFTNFCRVGSFRTLAASTNVCQFSQLANVVYWKSDDCGGSAFINDNATGTLARSVTTTVPTGIQVEAILRVQATGQAAATNVLVSPLDQNDQSAGAATNFSALGVGNLSGSEIRVRTSTAGQVRFRSTQAATVIYGTTAGWVDITRGQ